MFDALIFDLDGVLWNSSNSHSEAFKIIFNKHNVKYPGYNKIAGMKTIDVFNQEFPDSILKNINILSLSKEKTTLANKLLAKNAIVPTEIVDNIKKLSQTYPIGLASSSSLVNINLFFDKSQLKPFFDAVISGDDVTNAKPDPSIFLTVCERLGINPSRCLVVEDSIAGIQAAKNAKIKVAALIGTHTKKTLEINDPDWIIEHFSDVNDILDE